MSKSKLIAGIAFMLSEPYAAGHVVTEAEAKALNQVRSENIGNNLREQIKKAQAEGQSADAMQAIVSEYDGKYEFNLAAARQSAARLDPVEKIARQLAKEQIKAHLAAKNRKLTTVPDGMTKEAWEEKLEQQIDAVAQNPAIIAEAQKQVKAQQKRAESLAAAVGDIDLGEVTPAQVAAE